MKKKNFFIAIIFLLLIFLGFNATFKQAESPKEQPQAAPATLSLDCKEFLGEVISYDVRNFGIEVADAQLEFKGLVNIDGKEAYLITFEARGINFLDVEKIYADKNSLYPLSVERNLNIWGAKEKIIEIYDQQRFVVTATKTTKVHPQPQIVTIQKKDRIDNIYCFIYRYRLMGNFKLGDSLKMNLPTTDVSIRIVKSTPLDAAGKTFQTFFLETIPLQYRLWFDAGKEKIPLRIDKMAVVSGTTMIMSNYKK